MIKSKTSQNHQSGKLLIHFIYHDDVVYAYDAYSNQILKLDNQEHIILSGLSSGLSNEAIAQQLKKDLPDTDPTTSIENFLTQAKELGVFQPVPKRKVAPPPPLKDIELQLANHMDTLTLEVTQDCNYRCKYCAFTGLHDEIRDHNQHVMSMDTAKAAIDFFLPRTGHASGDLSFSFYGGEPLLAADTIRGVIEYVKTVVPDKPTSFHLTTNGAALNNPNVRKLLAENRISIMVSVDGPQRIHDAFRMTRTGKPTFKLIERGLTSLLAEYPEYYSSLVSINSVMVSNEFYDEIVEFFNEWPLSKAMRDDSIRINGVDTYDTKELMNLLSTHAPQPTHRSSEEKSSRQLFLENRFQNKLPDDGLDKFHGDMMVRLAQRGLGPISNHVEPSGYCMPGTRKLFVSVDGNLEMCEKTSGTMSIGSLSEGINTNRIHEILASMHDLWTEGCSACTAQRFCGSCPALIAKPNGALSPA